ncbi:hypothetical protein BGX34_002606 [Mortierella sp. NVP85]|nr:hypothetical protein BGX34_002606 [Mortierella sp. NVP85]
MSEISPQRSSRSNGTKKLSFSAILVLVFMLFNVMIPVVSALSKITSGTLEIGDYLESPDKTKRFVIQTDGNAVVYQGKQSLWASGALGTGRYYISLSNTGDLCVYNKDNNCVKRLSTIYNPVAGQWDLTLMNNGILILKDPKGVIRWNNFQYAQMTSINSERPFFDQCFHSSNYQYFLCMQHDGNFVVYNAYKSIAAYSGLYNRKSVYLYLSKTGILSLNTVDGAQSIVSKKTGGKVDTYRVGVTNEGKIRIDDSKGRLFELI